VTLCGAASVWDYNTVGTRQRLNKQQDLIFDHNLRALSSLAETRYMGIFINKD